MVGCWSPPRQTFPHIPCRARAALPGADAALPGCARRPLQLSHPTALPAAPVLLPVAQVRSNAQKQVGFLADERRMNVAVTRARRHCALVADSDTVTSDPFLQRLIAYFEAHGEYASAGEYVQS